MPTIFLKSFMFGAKPQVKLPYFRCYLFVGSGAIKSDLELSS